MTGCAGRPWCAEIAIGWASSNSRGWVRLVLTGIFSARGLACVWVVAPAVRAGGGFHRERSGSGARLLRLAACQSIMRRMFRIPRAIPCGRSAPWFCRRLAAADVSWSVFGDEVSRRFVKCLCDGEPLFGSNALEAYQRFSLIGEPIAGWCRGGLAECNRARDSLSLTSSPAFITRKCSTGGRPGTFLCD